MRLFVLAGPARVGKTTLAKVMAKEAFEAGYKPIMLPFAGPLKEEAEAKGFGKDTDPEGYRKYCQEVGHAKREENQDHWVNLWRSKIEALRAEDSESERVIIVDDCRYLNELAAVQELGGVVWFIHSGTRELIEHDAPWRQHDSEAMANVVNNTTDPLALGQFDFHISNDDSLGSFEWFTKHACFALMVSGWDSNDDSFRSVIADQIVENLDDLPEPCDS